MILQVLDVLQRVRSQYRSGHVGFQYRDAGRQCLECFTRLHIFNLEKARPRSGQGGGWFVLGQTLQLSQDCVSFMVEFHGVTWVSCHDWRVLLELIQRQAGGSDEGISHGQEVFLSVERVVADELSERLLAPLLLLLLLLLLDGRLVVGGELLTGDTVDVRHVGVQTVLPLESPTTQRAGNLLVGVNDLVSLQVIVTPKPLSTGITSKSRPLVVFPLLVMF